MNREAIGEAIFGSFDGMTSVIGVLAGLLVTHASAHTVLVTAAGLSAAAAVGMAGGEYLGDRDRRGRLHRAGVMGLATLLGALLPALPVALLPMPLGLFAALLLVLLMTGAIAEVRGRQDGRLRGYIQTTVILLLAAGLSILVTVALGVTA